MVLAKAFSIGFAGAFVCLIAVGCADELPRPPERVRQSELDENTGSRGTHLTHGYVMPLCGVATDLDCSPFATYEGPRALCREQDQIQYVLFMFSDPFFARWMRYLRDYRDWERTYGNASYELPLFVLTYTFELGSSWLNPNAETHTDKREWSIRIDVLETDERGEEYSFYVPANGSIDERPWGQTQPQRDVCGYQVFWESISLRSAVLEVDDPQNGPGMDFHLTNADPTWVVDWTRQ